MYTNLQCSLGESGEGGDNALISGVEFLWGGGQLVLQCDFGGIQAGQCCRSPDKWETKETTYMYMYIKYRLIVQERDGSCVKYLGTEFHKHIVYTVLFQQLVVG